MSTYSYLPSSESDQALWLRNFATKLPPYSAQLGITPAEVAAVTADSNMVTYAVDQTEYSEKETNKRRAYKNALLNGEVGISLGPFPTSATVAPSPAAVTSGVFKRIAKIVIRIKNHSAYTKAMGEDLGIETHNSASLSKADLKPEIKVTVNAGKPVIRWKKGKMKSADIYVDRGDGKGFVLLITTTDKEYTDMFEIPADTNVVMWHYKVIYRYGNEQAGNFSDIATVALMRQV